MEKIQLFFAKHVLPMDGNVLSPGGVAVQRGQILAVASPEQLKSRYPEATRHEHLDCVLLPGLVNAHADLSVTHFYHQKQPEFKTFDGRLQFMKWLLHLSRYKADLPIEAQMAAIREGLECQRRSGVTTLGDRCRYPIAVSLYRESGLRVVCLAEIENIQRPRALEEFEQALALVDDVAALPEDANVLPGLAPMSAYTLSKNLLRIVANHAQQLAVPMHLQCALTFSEMEFFFDSLGEISSELFVAAGWQDKIPPPHRMTPIQYLFEIGILKVKPVILGGIHLGSTDLGILQSHDCLQLIAPQAFRYLQLGEVSFEKQLKHSQNWGFATLGRAWGSDLNLWEEMRCLMEKIPPERQESAAIGILQAATLGGAKALHLESKVGSLAPRKSADFLLVDTKLSEDQPWSSLIADTKHRNLKAVYFEGKPLKKD